MNIQKRFTFLYIRGKLRLLSSINENWAADYTFRLICTPLLNSTIKKSEIFSKYDSITMNYKGKKIRGYSCGAGTKTALILHGFSSSSHNFDSYVESLISIGYRVLAFDAPAHGLSEGKTISSVEYSEFILELIKIYGHIDSFISHSFGGIAVMLALENIKADIKPKIVLIAPATETTTAIDHAFNFISIKDDKLKQALFHKIENTSGHPPSWFSIRRAVKNVDASILWIHDSDDNITPITDAIRVQEDLPLNVKFIFTKGLGHGRIYKDKKVQNQIFEFLQ